MGKEASLALSRSGVNLIGEKILYQRISGVWNTKAYGETAGKVEVFRHMPSHAIAVTLNSREAGVRANPTEEYNEGKAAPLVYMRMRRAR